MLSYIIIKNCAQAKKYIIDDIKKVIYKETTQELYIYSFILKISELYYNFIIFLNLHIPISSQLWVFIFQWREVENTTKTFPPSHELIWFQKDVHLQPG